jgi:hypothetical protein
MSVRERLKRIIYTAHLKYRIEKRRISPDIPKTIYQHSDEKYFDAATGHNVAVFRLDYSGSEREMMIAYDEFEDRIEIVTVHPLKWMQKQQRIKTKRWVRT